MNRVDVRPEMLRWARERAGVSVEKLARRFPKLPEWESGEISPTLKQLESFASATYAPIGILFLDEPPEEQLPIPDFRTKAGRKISKPSPNLLDTIYICIDRQEWFRTYQKESEASLLSFVGSKSLSDSVIKTAADIRREIGFDLEQRARCSTWTEALRMFIGQTENAGILVMCSGVVLNNNRRILDPEEFRGFALADELAPLVFVNGADSKSAQMFTLAHELAHIWLGQTALSDDSPSEENTNQVERWCNQVAAEMLAPKELVLAEISKRSGENTADLVVHIAKRFKVSSLVAIGQLRNVGLLSWKEFHQAYQQEITRLSSLPTRSGGGDFYLTTLARSSRKFATALVESTLEGKTLYRDAFRLLGLSKTETFNELGRSLKFKA